MSAFDFGGSIPERYERYLGPLFLHHYAKVLAERLRVANDARVLEVACGTGIVTERLRARLPDSVELVATDLNESMLAVAREKRGGLSNLRFQTADAMALPFEDASFDAVVCQFGLMLVPDKVAAMREARRVLRPGGSFLFNVWDSLERNPVVKLGRQTVAKFFDSDPPAFIEIPFGYHALDPIKASLHEAGFHEIEISVLPATVEGSSAREAALGFVTGNPGVREIEERATVPVETIVDAVEKAFAREYGDRPMRVRLQAIFFTAQKGID